MTFFQLLDFINVLLQVTIRGARLFFKCYLVVPQPTLGNSQGYSLTNLMLITVLLLQFQPEGDQGPRNEVWVPKLSRASSRVWFGNFPILIEMPLVDIQYSERLYLLNTLFVGQFSTMIETYRKNFGYWWSSLQVPNKVKFMFS